MKVYKVELMIVDVDNIGADAVKNALENQRYPNHCIAPHVMNVDERDVVWHDSHPLNKRATVRSAYADLFNTKKGF